jgi:acyl carrier protein
MTNNEKVVQAVMEAIDQLNEHLPRENKLEKSVDTSLFGSGGRLDSLGLVSLVTTVEQKIEEHFGITATLLEDIAGLEDGNPFKTVKTLADYATSVLEKKGS